MKRIFHPMRHFLAIVALMAFCLPASLYSQCTNIIYVAPYANGVGTHTDPAGLVTSIYGASSGDVIRMATGTYNITSPITNIPSGVTLEGGFQRYANWRKTSEAGATTINRQGGYIEDASGNQPRLVAIYIDGSSDFHIMDLTIQTANVGIGLNAAISNYGVHLTNCSNYYFTRVQILAGNGGSGVQGVDGEDGVHGGLGGNGSNGSVDDECNPGRGGRGAATRVDFRQRRAHLGGQRGVGQLHGGPRFRAG